MSFEFWWLWFLLAAFLLVGEILTFGFFLLWFGIGAVAAGVCALLGLGLVWQLTVFFLGSLILLALSKKVADRISYEQPQGVGATRFLGSRCVVLEAIDNLKNTGRVRMGKEEWRAESESGLPIPKGLEVIVTAVSGTHLIVKPLDK